MKKTLCFAASMVACLVFAGCASPDGGCKTSDAAGTPVANAANSKCPIGGHDANGSGVMTSYKGKNVQFCCADCKPEWDKMTDAQKDAALAKVAAK